MTALVLAQHDDGELDDTVLNAVAAARQLGGPVHLLVAGADIGPVAEAAARIEGVEKVLKAEAAHLTPTLAETLAPLLVELAGGYDHLVAAATTFGKNVMPRVAALLDVAQVSDVVAVEAPDTFQRYIYAGNALATVRSKDARRVLTVRPTAFAQAAADGGGAEISAVDVPEASSTTRFIGRDVSAGERPDLGSAKFVVSGGRGIGSAENFKLVEELADSMGAAVGASRAAVDAGFAPNEWQVGQTGKIVAPQLYVAVGISGAIQHLAGMKDSKVIVAINKDGEAPIFQVADYGLVGDLFKLLPELTEVFRKPRA